jgi:nucleotide-binding universal stress UspA family protein
MEHPQDFPTIPHRVDETLSKEPEGYLCQVNQSIEIETKQHYLYNHALHLLLAIGSDAHASTTLFWAAADLANRLPLQITILHCREWELAKGAKYFLESKHEATSIITSATKWFSALNIPSHGVLCNVERGGIGRAIANTSIDYRVDSIMVGLHHRKRLFPGLRGSTVRQIERLVDCPIIIIAINEQHRL